MSIATKKEKEITFEQLSESFIYSLGIDEQPENLNESTFMEMSSVALNDTAHFLARFDNQKSMDKSVLALKGDITRGANKKGSIVYTIKQALESIHKVQRGNGKNNDFYARMPYSVIEKDVSAIEGLLKFMETNRKLFISAHQGKGNLMIRSLFNSLILTVAQSTIYVFYNYIERTDGSANFKPLPNKEYERYASSSSFIRMLRSFKSQLDNRELTRILNRQSSNKAFIAESMSIFTEGKILDFIKMGNDGIKDIVKGIEADQKKNQTGGFSTSNSSTSFKSNVRDFMDPNGSEGSLLGNIREMIAKHKKGSAVVTSLVAAFGLFMLVRYTIVTLVSNGVFGDTKENSLSKALNIMADEIEQNANEEPSEVLRQKQQKRAEGFRKFARRVNSSVNIISRKLDRKVIEDQKKFEREADAEVKKAKAEAQKAEENISKEVKSSTETKPAKSMADYFA